MTKRGAPHSPPFPQNVQTSYLDCAFGRMRSRWIGQRRPGVPELVLVQGMGVADYLMPGVGALGQWTRAHLLELPGFAGSGDPPFEPTVAQFAEAVAEWLTIRRLGTVVLAGHSSGTQVAAQAAVDRPDVAGVALASPTIDPVARGLIRLFVRWRLDGRREPPGLTESHRPEWKRAGIRRMLHLVRVHLDHTIEEAVAGLTMPLLIIRGRDDRISTARWGRRLAALARTGVYTEVPGAHTFPWRDPHAWSDPLRRFTTTLT